jgi:hypothetical protein
MHSGKKWGTGPKLWKTTEKYFKAGRCMIK